MMPARQLYAWLEDEAKLIVKPDSAAAAEAGGSAAALVRMGARLSKIKGCSACHSSDGTEMVGPTFKGIFGRSEVVIAGGAEKQIVIDEDYLRNSIMNPASEIVKDFKPLMPPQQGLINDEELDAIIEYLKQLR